MVHAVRTGLFCFCAIAALGQTCERLLSPAAAVQDLLAGEEGRCYRVPMPAGQVLQVSILEQQGIAGILSIMAPDGTAMAQADFAQRAGRQKSLSVVTEAAGDYKLVLAPANHAPIERRLELRIGPAHEATANDRLRASAEKALGSGEELGRRMEPDARQTALPKYEE